MAEKITWQRVKKDPTCESLETCLRMPPQILLEEEQQDGDEDDDPPAPLLDGGEDNIASESELVTLNEISEDNFVDTRLCRYQEW
jgi:hypothetical protein